MRIARAPAPCGDDSTPVDGRRFAGACATALFGLLSATAGAETGPAFAIGAVERVVAMSDLHGAHQAFAETLASAGLIDGSGDWAGGAAHLVVNGDIVDRGDASRASLDLLMRLEPQAAAAGGGVHVVLGNHDVMNIIGDLRYVTRGEFAAFATEETAAQRESAYRRQASASPRALSRAEFDERFPPGYFAHRAAFSASGRYGRWLLGKPVALRIGDTLFVHAGISAALPVSDMAALAAMRDGLVEFAQLLEQAIARGLLDATTDFYDMPKALSLAVESGSDSAPLARRLLQLHDAPLHSPMGPLWYRGNAGCGPLIEQDRLARTLAAFGAKRVVIGHTPTAGRQAWRRLGDRVWMIDTGIQHAYYGGQGTALVIERGSPLALDQGAAAPVAVDELPARAGALSAGVSPEELESALASAEIVGRSPTEQGEALTLRWKGAEFPALFLPAAGAKAFDAEIAAYRLDRLLGLGMVPAAVRRQVDGRPGTVLFLPPSLVPESKRAAGDARVDAWCPLQDQWAAMYVFDALIGNVPRSAEELAYVRGSGQLVLAGHRRAFGTGTGLPSHLGKAPLGVNAEWRRRLAALESPEAREQLAPVLSGRQLAALLRRAAVIAK